MHSWAVGGEALKTCTFMTGDLIKVWIFPVMLFDFKQLSLWPQAGSFPSAVLSQGTAEALSPSIASIYFKHFLQLSDGIANRMFSAAVTTLHPCIYRERA